MENICKLCKQPISPEIAKEMENNIQQMVDEKSHFVIKEKETVLENKRIELENKTNDFIKEKEIELENEKNELENKRIEQIVILLR